MSGKALEVYSRIPSDEVKDYKKLKVALLQRYNLTEDGFRDKLRNSRIKPARDCNSRLRQSNERSNANPNRGAAVAVINEINVISDHTQTETERVQVLFAGIQAFDNICGPHWTFQPEEKRPDIIKNAINRLKNQKTDTFQPLKRSAFKENGTGFLVGNSPTIADCALFHNVSFFDEMPEYGDLLDGFPHCKAFLTKFSEIPGVKKYINGPRRFPVPDDEYTVAVKAALNI
ncbi:Glutathione S-transferase [Holothuria leucospilota]|uniref:Glutathione S-transferase n=1 Tax=Holothuria leucospilota TaxID=206669 RepID=A0A9Q1BIZ6_HOLLE|nr:Glutathione S-transferase [Holothuria leucospilota]